jgi:sugar O-acyltransferase (sialic acid O-acetyltransferase NeuD family)
MQKLMIYGAGGHARLIIDIVHKSGEFEIVGLIDDNPDREDENMLGEKVKGTFADLRHLSNEISGLIIGIGDNRARRRVWEKLRPLGVNYAQAVHPSAILGGEVLVGEGTVVMAGTVISCRARVGCHSIVNTRSLVGHDCRIGDFVHIAPGAVLCGTVRVGDLSLVGASATLLPSVTVGREVVVGAGSVVTKDIPDGVRVVGVPARRV